MTMTAAQIRAITVKLPAAAPVVVHLEDGQYLEIVGYTNEADRLILETVFPEGEQ